MVLKKKLIIVISIKPQDAREIETRESTTPRGLSFLRLLPELFLRLGVRVSSYFYNFIV